MLAFKQSTYIYAHNYRFEDKQIRQRYIEGKYQGNPLTSLSRVPYSFTCCESCIWYFVRIIVTVREALVGDLISEGCNHSFRIPYVRYLMNANTESSECTHENMFTNCTLYRRHPTPPSQNSLRPQPKIDQYKHNLQCLGFALAS